MPARPDACGGEGKTSYGAGARNGAGGGCHRFYLQTGPTSSRWAACCRRKGRMIVKVCGQYRHCRECGALRENHEVDGVGPFCAECAESVATSERSGG